MGLSYRVHVGPFFKITAPADKCWADIYGLTDGNLRGLEIEGDLLAFPNVTREGKPREFSFDPKREEPYVEISPVEIHAESRWLIKAFAPELTKLREAFGADNVMVAWGLVANIS